MMSMRKMIIEQYNELEKLLNDFSDSKKKEIQSKIDTIVKLETSKIENLQIISVQASQLRKGDIIFNKKTERLYPITFVAKRTECQFNVPKDNIQILICFANDEANEYAVPDDTYLVLMDMRKMDELMERTIETMQFEDEF